MPAETHLLAATLIPYADDEGYFNANPVLLKAGTTPLRNDQTRLEEQLAQLESIGYIEVRREGVRSIGHIVNFKAHQRVSHPTPSVLREKFENMSGDPPENFANGSGKVPETFRPERKGKEGKGREFASESREPINLPEWLPREEWEAFREMRRKIRKPLTEHAEALAIKRLQEFYADGLDAVDMLQQAVMNNWQGFVEEKAKKRKVEYRECTSPEEAWPDFFPEARAH